MNYFIAALSAFLLTVLLIKLAIKFFPKLGLMDRPHKYGLTRAPIPYYGGTIIVLVFMLCTFVFVPLDFHVLMMLCAGLLIAGVSFADDYAGLSPWLRLFVQILAALILVFSGIGIHSISNPLGAPLVFDKFMLNLDGIYNLSVIGALFTVIWVVTIINTMNWLDGLNGLPSGVGAIAALTLFLLSTRPGIHYNISNQVPVAMMSIIMFAVCAGFWLFDFYPAKILMGDTGSMFLGFLLATLAIFNGGKVATAFLVLGFPILDAAWVIIRRIMQGKSPLKGDLKHFHHRLLQSGFSNRKALLIIYSVCAAFGLIAVYLEGRQKLYAILTMLMLMIIMGGTAAYLGNKKGGDITKR